MKIQRNWVTPVTAGAFLLSAVTGVLIFFHVETGANKFMHEWLGWVLLGGAALHVVANLGGLKSHLATVRGKTLSECSCWRWRRASSRWAGPMSRLSCNRSEPCRKRR